MKSMQYFTLILIGLIIPLQAISNAKLGDKLGHPLWGALSNFVIAFIIISFSIVFTGLGKPDFSEFNIKHMYLFFGGLVGAIYIFTSLIYVPKIGGLIFFSTIIAVQLIASLLYDHYGILGKHISITPNKVLGIALLLLGSYLISKP